jgi:glycosyltransferase involved in cell wall biosynthesis
MRAIRLSLVIPAWNEAERMPALLDSIDVARCRHAAAGMDAGAIEVIVADNGSTDATAAIAAARGCRVAQIEKRVIAANRNGGATLAHGQILAFVDADCVIHPDCLLAVDSAMTSPRVIGGASGITMERWSTGIALGYGLLGPLQWLTRIDSGVVFCRRDDFEALGGYDEARAFAEDVDFLWRLRRLGRQRGQRLRGVKTITSTRKFDRHGDWHWFSTFPRLAWRMLLDRRATRDFVDDYWYRRRD